MLLTCLLITVSSPSFGQEIDSTQLVETPTVIDTKIEHVDFRIPPQSKIEKYQDDKRFDYYEVEKKKEEGPSVLDYIYYWIIEIIFGGIGKVVTSGATGWIFIIAIIVLLVFLIAKISGANLKSIFGKKKIDTDEIEIYKENVHQMNFDTLIVGALANKDYRLAVRFLYLKNLKTLTDKGIIKWNVNKTNYAYINEISKESLRNIFSETTLIFDYVWYGEFDLDEMKYDQIYSRMDNLNKMVANER